MEGRIKVRYHFLGGKAPKCAMISTIVMIDDLTHEKYVGETLSQSIEAPPYWFKSNGIQVCTCFVVASIYP